MDRIGLGADRVKPFFIYTDSGTIRNAVIVGYMVTSRYSDRGLRFNTLLGAELKGAIAAHGFSGRSTAAAIGVTDAALNRYLNGKKAIPVPTFIAACEAIGADPREIVARAYARLQSE